MVRVAVCLVLVTVFCESFEAQEKTITQTARMDNTRIGAYRALAQLSYQAFEKGDHATAAELARVLERTWDGGEWDNASEGSFCKANRSVCLIID
jgi:hypothetical protein